MKSTHYIFLAIASLILACIGGCNDSKSYSDLLTEEEHAVNWYLAQNKVELNIPADSVFITGKDAPFYKMKGDGSVYMRVVNPGDPDRKPKKGETVYFRFMRQNIKYLQKGIDHTTGEGNQENLGNSLNGLSFIYGNNILESTTRFGTGIQLPLNYLGYNCEVDLVIKSIEGFATDISQCNPYIYKGVKYFKAEY